MKNFNSTPRIALILFAACLVASCGGDKQKVVFDWETADLVFSYPYDGQPQVPTTAPLVLRFAQPLTYADQAALDLDIASKVRLENVSNAGVALPYSAKMVDGKRSLVITPSEKLGFAQSYVLILDGLETSKGVVTFPDAPIEFSTRAASAGARDTRVEQGAFRITRAMPDDTDLPIMDFSDVRLQFSQPLNTETVSYGDGVADSVSLLDASGAVVDALVLAKGPFLTIDPLTDLIAGEDYTLSVGANLQSEFGDAVEPWSLAFTPKDSMPRETLVQRAAASSDVEADQCTTKPGVLVSPLTGDAINCVPVKATLLGDESASQQVGDVHAELAFVPNYPVVTPLRIARGSLLTGSNVDLLIAGKVPAGFGTDAISVKFISDAVGYLLPNSYSKSEASPRHVRLIMDVAMTAEDRRANGGLSQDLMHIELAGIAIVIDGILTIDAVGVVEPNVLGVEEAYGVLSFHMEAYADQDNAPAPAVDTIAPTLQSWVPGDNVAKQSSENPIILNFSEALDPKSVTLPGAVSVSKDGVMLLPEDWDAYFDGASLVIKPKAPLAYRSEYTVQLSALITDIAGNALVTGGVLAADYTVSFEMPNYIGAALRSPLALTTYPGFPCVTEDRALALGDHGVCAGSLATDDHLPVSKMPTNRAIRVQFSQDMDPTSIALAGSFRVEKSVASVWEPVPGDIDVKARSITFWPETPWDESGATMYRYVLGSQGAAGNSAVLCDGTRTLCDVFGLPLQTQVIAQTAENVPGPTDGGPDMEIYFVGAPASTTVYQPARNLPAIDVNSNQIHEGRTDADYDADTQIYPGCVTAPESCEDLPLFDASAGDYVTPPNATKIVENGVGAGNALITRANVGCGFTGNFLAGYTPRSCPERKFVYLTGALNVEVIGPTTYPPTGEDAVLVHVLPTLLMTSSLDFYAIATLIGEQFNPTGPMIMRVRYSCDDVASATCKDVEDTSALSDRNQPVIGYILDTPEGPVFEVQFDLYLDAPSLNPLNLGGSTHNQHSFPLSLTLRGPINFLDDGRMEVEQVNDVDVPLAIEVLGNTINVVIPAGGVNLNYTTAPAKQ